MLLLRPAGSLANRRMGKCRQFLSLLTALAADAIPALEMPHLFIAGLDTHYKEKGQGFPIVLIHGYTGVDSQTS